MKESSPRINVRLSEYEDLNKLTDRLPYNEITPVLFGLFGEVGSVMSTSKKLIREKEAFEADFSRDFEEELGDTLWYVVALCRRLKIHPLSLFSEFLDDKEFTTGATLKSHKGNSTVDCDLSIEHSLLNSNLLHLGEQSTNLLRVEADRTKARKSLEKFIQAYVDTIKIFNVPFTDVIKNNTIKIRDRFVPPPLKNLPEFDDKLLEKERIPREFEIEVAYLSSGKIRLRWAGKKRGNLLSDDIAIPDDYRFHDVFHFAYAAILHWSPAFRKLIERRRQGKNFIDAQDGARPRLIEEGLSAYIFSYAKPLNFFEKQETVSFSLLKTIQNFVRGYEVEKCPLYFWEKAILQGFDVFREIRKMRKGETGIVIGNREARTLLYKPPK